MPQSFEPSQNKFYPPSFYELYQPIAKILPETILKCIKGNRSPVKVSTRDFGMIAAAYQAACFIDLPQILMKHIKGERFETNLWIYFFITIINRLDSATSKEKMRMILL